MPGASIKLCRFLLEQENDNLQLKFVTGHQGVVGGYDKSCGLALSFALIFHVSVVSISVSGERQDYLTLSVRCLVLMGRKQVIGANILHLSVTVEP